MFSRSVKRVKTGIHGLDPLIEGGFPAGRTYLVCGEAGAGKTTFALQYIYSGALEDEPGVYLTIDEKPKHIVEDALSLGWDLEKLMDENKLLIAEISPYFEDVEKISVERIVDEIKSFLAQSGAKRLAIDPLAPLILRSEKAVDPLTAEMKVRNYIRGLIHNLDELGVTTVATSEIPTGTNRLSRYGVEEFVASGVIVLALRRSEMGFQRELYIRKMRGVNHSMNVYTFIIQGERGIVISL